MLAARDRDRLRPGRAVLILLGRAFVEPSASAGHPRLIVVALVGLVGVIALLTYLGVELPREVARG